MPGCFTGLDSGAVGVLAAGFVCEGFSVCDEGAEAGSVLARAGGLGLDAGEEEKVEERDGDEPRRRERMGSSSSSAAGGSVRRCPV